MKTPHTTNTEISLVDTLQEAFRVSRKHVMHAAQHAHRMASQGNDGARTLMSKWKILVRAVRVRPTHPAFSAQ